MLRLCFDYGHGGEDSGAIYKGRKESNDVLRLGRAIASDIRRLGITVEETRTSDVTVKLKNRSDFENRSTYDYFISFHRNAYLPEKANGVETYTYLNPGSKSKRLATRIQATSAYIKGLGAKTTYVIGETDTVSDAIAKALPGTIQ